MNGIAISVINLSKKYLLYDTPQHRLKEALHPLRKKYHHDFNALYDVSFEVKKGEAVGIIGRNGSGKSTLLKIIAGVLTPTSGSVQVNGSISSLLELGAGFNPELTGIENVYFNGTLMGYSREEMDARLDDILAFADIGEFVHQPVKMYSSGMFVRLAFAVAVCVDPEILIVDEALSVGDMAFQQKCLDRLRTLREKGVTILLVTHDIMLTRNYCEYVVYLQNGRVALLADAETAGEAYLEDMKSEVQKLVNPSEKARGANALILFGDRDGDITAVEVTNPHSGLPIFADNDPLLIRVQARVKKMILFPRIYVQIRDFRGYIIYGIHSMPEELQRIGEDEYVALSAALSIRTTLGPGEYGVTVSINNAPGEMNQIVLDKQVAAATFTVLSKAGSRGFQGSVNLHAVWEKTADNLGTSLPIKNIMSDASSLRLLIGCVAENTPKYLSQALRLLQSVRWFGGKIANAQFTICVIEGVDASFKSHFERYGATVRIVPRYNLKCPVTNKIRFLQQEDILDYDTVILLDCDTIIVQDPSSFLSEKVFRAKISDGPTIPHEIFAVLFEFFGMPLPTQNYSCTVWGQKTIPYFNTGVLIFPKTTLLTLVSNWIEFTNKLVENIGLIPGREHFCEQASMALALAASGERYEVIGNEMNFPTHFEHREESALLHDIDPFIIHYHSCFDAEGYINGSKYPLANARIDRFNQRMRQESNRLS
jgi:ABC-type polysaccharide/polyol phosphate transport system ATPase subunit